MMATIEITVKKMFPYKGKHRKVGDKLTVPLKFGNVLIAIGKADQYIAPVQKEEKKVPPRKSPARSKSPSVKATVSVNQGEEESRPKTYQTRDMKAE